MRDKRTTIVILALAVLVLAGCEEAYRAYQDPSYIPSETELTRIVEEWPDDDPLKPTAQAVALSRYATAVAADSVAQQAQLTVDAAKAQGEQQRAILTAEAQATRDALSAQATQQALSAQATREALAVEATRTAEAEAAARRATAQAVEATRTVEAQRATATAQVANVTATAQAASVQATKDAEAATATAVSGQATATVQAQWDQATRVALQATQESERLDLQREKILHPLKIAGVILFVLAGAAALGYLGWRAWMLYEDRQRLVRRDPDEGEPILLLSRERLAMPMRQFGAYADLTQGNERAPLLAPSVEAQEGATMRQQTANAIQARQVEGVAKAKHGTQPDRNIVVLPKAAAREYSDPQLPPIHVRDAGDMKPLIEDVRRQLESGEEL